MYLGNDFELKKILDTYGVLLKEFKGIVRHRKKAKKQPSDKGASEVSKPSLSFPNETQYLFWTFYETHEEEAVNPPQTRKMLRYVSSLCATDFAVKSHVH